MKIFKILLSLVLLTVLSCSQEVEIRDKPNEKQPLSSGGGTQVKIGENNAGVLSITYLPISTLESELKSYWDLSTLANLRIEHEGGEFWLKGDGNLNSGGHIDWALILDNQSDDLFLVVNGGSQSCTARECCSECKLLISSDVSGSCSCTAININFECAGPGNDNKKTCGHTVTSGLNTDQAYLDLLNNLN